MIKLYPDQEEVIANLKQAMMRNKSILLQSATGSGKTAMATYMLAAAKAKGKRVLFTVPRRQLMEQTSETFQSYNLHHSYIAAGKPFNPYASAYIGMVDTMARRIDKLPDADLVIVDETHYGSGSLGAVIERYKKQGSWVIGLSATPWKSSGQGLGCWYDDMVQGKSIRWLIDNKRLSDYRYFRARHRLDFSGIDVTAGDYNQKQLDGYMAAHEKMVIGDCVGEYREKAMGRLHIVRCVSIARSQVMAQSFRDAGIPAMHVDGETPDDEMKRIIKAYARREILVLTFCDLLNFGFDLSQASGMDVCIESASDTKPSKSLAGQMQFNGRWMRYKPIPALCFDHVNNWEEHGLPCSDREWTLADRKQGKKTTERAPPTRQCPQCFNIHKPAPTCTECGHVYEIKGREIEEEDGELVEVDKTAAVKQRKMEQGKAATLDDLIAVGKSRGMRYPAQWAAKVIAGRLKKNASY